MGRQFFVGGNFKMFVFLVLCSNSWQCSDLATYVLVRNGTIKSIIDIINNLNNASLDPKTGEFLATPQNQTFPSVGHESPQP